MRKVISVKSRECRRDGWRNLGGDCKTSEWLRNYQTHYLEVEHTFSDDLTGLEEVTKGERIGDDDIGSVANCTVGGGITKGSRDE